MNRVDYYFVSLDMIFGLSYDMSGKTGTSNHNYNILTKKVLLWNVTPYQSFVLGYYETKTVLYSTAGKDILTEIII